MNLEDNLPRDRLYLLYSYPCFDLFLGSFTGYPVGRAPPLVALVSRQEMVLVVNLLENMYAVVATLSSPLVAWSTFRDAGPETRSVCLVILCIRI